MGDVFTASPPNPQTPKPPNPQTPKPPKPDPVRSILCRLALAIGLHGVFAGVVFVLQACHVCLA